MSASRFTSTVKLYQVDEISKNHFPSFSSVANQTAFFEHRKKFEVTNCKMIRNVNSVRVNIPTKSLYGEVNYLSYTNPDYDNETIYCIIKGRPMYVNDQCTEIFFAEDPIQTKLFDVECDAVSTLIEREHASAAHHTTAETEPFASALWELATAESLPVGPDLEKTNVTFTSYNSDPTDIKSVEAGKLFPQSLIPEFQDMISVIWLSKIDFTGLDKESQDAGATELPSDIFDNYLNDAGNEDYGFAIDYSGEIRSIDATAYGSSSLVPINAYKSQCAIIALPQSVSDPTAGHSMEMLLDILTTWGTLSSIVNLVVVPKELLTGAFRASGQYTGLDLIEIDAPTTEHDPKLLRFPYSYMRLITPAGDIKELHYEYFRNVSSPGTDNTMKFAIGTDIVNGISLIVVPDEYRNYLVRGGAYSYDSSAMVKFDQIPTAPYTIDSFLSQMAATAQERVKQNTVTTQMSRVASGGNLMARTSQEYLVAESAATAGNVVKGLVTDIATGNVTGALSQQMAVNVQAAERASRGLERQVFDTTNALQESAGALLAGDTMARGIAEIEYAHTKAAYASSDYHAPTGAGFQHFSTYGWLNIAFQHVKLREDILNSYDAFFAAYGYTSGRIGKPYIFNFIAGSSNNQELPTWIDGQTYVKTAEAHVTGALQFECEFWEAALNAGIHWVNGDEIING